MDGLQAICQRVPSLLPAVCRGAGVTAWEKQAFLAGEAERWETGILWAGGDPVKTQYL